ncbi:phosphotransferase [Ornithinibacillus halophilus]|uniref:Ser/Thr protein kinase RdoA involved in Cpx stress response, MazF antagonist n=1 Tax=Ornithinibacillus halophilus TaxID=930117 RepID=A0A1M5MC45_9BACI|nr:phosphotransferase [Ornithinibacillus halophilus]SHG74934.1 Ser/Thr protein kinase RdoA involved in Cpx stress response, MazF antagonist [Ornithinibacillus halophilus]
MKIAKEKLNEICNLFALDGVESCQLVRHIDDHNTIIQINAGNKRYIVKLYHDSFTTKKGLEKQGQLCNTLHPAIPVPQRYKTIDGYFYTEIKVDGKCSLVTVEEYMDGTEIEIIDINVIRQIAQLLAVQHNISEESGMRFGYGTSWSMFGGNETDAFGDYDENELCFRELIGALKANNYDKQLIDQISASYLTQRGELHQIWSELPKGAVQGDFCPYNMLLDDEWKIGAIFDFNLAGDEVFINECLAIAVYLAFSHLKRDGTSLEYLQAFLVAYREKRNLSIKEYSAIQPLIRVLRPFRYERVDGIMEWIKQGKREEVELKLKETVKLLNLNYHY